MSKIEIKNAITYAREYQEIGEPFELEAKPWPDPCGALWDAYIVNKDYALAYKIVLKHWPNLAHEYKPDVDLENE